MIYFTVAGFFFQCSRRKFVSNIYSIRKHSLVIDDINSLVTDDLQLNTYKLSWYS